MRADLLVHDISRLAIIPGPGPRRGTDLGAAGVVADGALLVHERRVVWAGPRDELPAIEGDVAALDAGGRAVVPGFVDSHTHALFAGSRLGEFEQRVQGVTYQQLLAEGGGILATVAATQAASVDELVAATSTRLETMLALGTTTVEIKTGYGLETEAELRMLQALVRLSLLFRGRMTIVPTFMPAHALPTPFRDDPDRFVDLIVEEMLPAAMAAHISNDEENPIFADVFCEAGVFTVAQTRRILSRARSLGYRLKLHADEFEPLGGTTLAAELGATSVDHLTATGPEEMARLAASETVATLLPGTTFGLGKQDYAPARAWIAAGAAVALATDLNPGTAPCPSMPFIMALAARYLRMTPAECLVAGTLNGAHALGMGHRVGSLAPGYEADFLILATPDERDLSYRFGENLVAAVFKGGSLVAGTVGG